MKLFRNAYYDANAELVFADWHETRADANRVGTKVIHAINTRPIPDPITFQTETVVFDTTRGALVKMLNDYASVFSTRQLEKSA